MTRDSEKDDPGCTLAEKEMSPADVVSVELHFNLSLSAAVQCCLASGLKSLFCGGACCWRLKRMEHCENPWNKECKKSDIEVYIQFRGERRPICRRCWSRLADKDGEW